MKPLLTILLVLNLYILTGQTLNLNPEIQNLVSKISKDSISNTIQGLQNYGTRFCLNDNHRDIAVWLKNQFISYGYLDTELDSFCMVKNISGYPDTSWQYNVVAKYIGSETPDIYYIAGGHYDSYSSDFNNAPGADDDASGTAATLELARVFKQNNYKPKSTIVFIAFAAEELMNYITYNGDNNGCGSKNYAHKAFNANMNIRLMINNDMISHNTNEDTKIRLIIPDYQTSWVGIFTSNICTYYTNLQPIIPYYSLQKSDHYPFFEKGYKTIFFQEYNFDPNYHTPNDIITNHDMDYCTEVTKISCAMLAHLSRNTVITNLKALSEINRIRLSWEDYNNILGYNIYRSDSSGGNFEKINNSIIADTFYIDTLLETSKYYYYKITSIDNQNYESIYSNEVQAMAITFANNILIVDDSKTALLSPTDSVVDCFYNNLFSDYDFTNYDVVENSNNIDLSTLGKYKNIVWHVETYSSSSIFFKCRDEIIRYLEAGGNLLLSTEKISYTTEHYYSSVFKEFKPQDFSYDYLKINSLSKNSTVRFIGANSNNSYYNELKIDTNKTPLNYNHHISGVEAIFPTNDASIIFTFNTEYDTSTVEGSYLNYPVGIEYIGDKYKTITLSYPLYYMKFDDAKSLIDTIFQNKFNTSGIFETKQNNIQSEYVKIYPNPFIESTKIEYYIPTSSNVSIEIYDSFGKIVKIPLSKFQSSGHYSITINYEDLMPGIYYCIIKTQNYSKTSKIVKLK